MKRFMLLIQLLCIYFLYSCTDVEMLTMNSDIHVVADAVHSRTLFSEEGDITHVLWEATDEKVCVQIIRLI